jgi:hypothetical protein
MVGFDAPLTFETKDVLGRPKDGRAAMRNVSAIAHFLHVIYRFSLSHFLLGDPLGGI